MISKSFGMKLPKIIIFLQLNDNNMYHNISLVYVLFVQYIYYLYGIYTMCIVYILEISWYFFSISESNIIYVAETFTEKLNVLGKINGLPMSGNRCAPFYFSFLWFTILFIRLSFFCKLIFFFPFNWLGLKRTFCKHQRTIIVHVDTLKDQQWTSFLKLPKSDVF